jgi:hypothetical protein
MERQGGMIPTGENSWYVHQSSRLVAKQEEQGEENDKFYLRIIPFHIHKVNMK